MASIFANQIKPNDKIRGHFWKNCSISLNLKNSISSKYHARIKILVWGPDAENGDSTNGWVGPKYEQMSVRPHTLS